MEVIGFKLFSDQYVKVFFQVYAPHFLHSPNSSTAKNSKLSYSRPNFVTKSKKCLLDSRKL